MCDRKALLHLLVLYGQNAHPALQKVRETQQAKTQIMYTKHPINSQDSRDSIVKQGVLLFIKYKRMHVHVCEATALTLSLCLASHIRQFEVTG